MEHDEADQNLCERTLRTRLVHISDELAALASDSFAAKHALNVEGDEIRSALRALQGDQAAELDAWAERAARKGIPKTDEEILAEVLVRLKGFESSRS